MGNFGGSYSKDPRLVLDERKRFISLLCQQDIPWSDVDDNLNAMLLFSLVRRLAGLFGTGAEGDAWKPVGVTLNNNLQFRGGGGTLDTALSFWIKGWRVPIFTSVNFANSGSIDDEKLLHSRSSGLTKFTLTDTSANFKPNELVGRSLVPNITQPLVVYPIVSNTETTITCSVGDLRASASVGDHYYVTLTTPSGADRNDDIYLNCYLDEVDSVEEPSLLRTIEGTVMECKRALRLVHTIHIRQGDSTNFVDYVDADGNQHYVYKLGSIHRHDGIDVIDPVDVVDERKILMIFADIRSELARIALFCGTASGFYNMPVYSQAYNFPQNSPLNQAIDALDVMLGPGGMASVGEVVVPGYKSFSSLESAFADGSLPDNSAIMVLSDNRLGDPTVSIPNVTVLEIFFNDALLGLEQDGKITGLSGMGESSILRYLAINSNININGIYFSNPDSQTPNGVELYGAGHVLVQARHCIFNTPFIFTFFTGTFEALFENCEFYQPLSLSLIASWNWAQPISIKSCHFLSTVSFSGTGTLFVENSYFATTPVCSAGLSLEMTNCFLNGLHYSFVKVDSTGIVYGIFFEPSMTTAQRNAMLAPPDGGRVFNSTLLTSQFRSGGVWADSISRVSQRFVGFDVPASSTNLALSFEDGIVEDIALFDSQIVGLSIHCDPGRSAGTLTAKVTIDGVVVATLSPVLDGTKPTKNYQVVAVGTAALNVAKGHTFGVVVTTDGSWLPVDNTVVAVVHLITKGD